MVRQWMWKMAIKLHVFKGNLYDIMYPFPVQRPGGSRDDLAFDPCGFQVAALPGHAWSRGLSVWELQHGHGGTQPLSAAPELSSGPGHHCKGSLSDEAT